VECVIAAAAPGPRILRPWQLALVAVLPIALAADTISITIMEIVATRSCC
jgi:hypothetical protein